MLDNLQILIAAPAVAVDLLIQGVFIGAIFALVAYGLALVWGVMNVKNLCQGDYVIMGGYIAYVVAENGANPILALPVAFVLMFMFGWAVYVAVILAGALALGIVLFMRHSRMGRAIRATAQDPRAARVLGVNTDQVYAFTYALNAAICGAAGVLVSLIWVIQPYFGIVYSIRAFVIVTAAGLGNLPGVILAGFGLGIAENMSAFLLGAEFAVAAVVSMLLIVLIYRQIQLYRVRQVVR